MVCGTAHLRTRVRTIVAGTMVVEGGICTRLSENIMCDLISYGKNIYEDQVVSGRWSLDLRIPNNVGESKEG